MLILLAIGLTICTLSALWVRYMMQDQPKVYKGLTIIKAAYPMLFYLKFIRVLNTLTQHQTFVCALMQCAAAATYASQMYKLIEFDLLNLKMFFFLKPEVVEVLLNSSTNIDKADFYKFLHPWLGRGLLTSSGDRWRNRRKLLTPAFHFTILQDFLPVFNEQSSILVAKLRDHSSRKPYVDIAPLILACTLDVICETAMGVSTNAQENESDYLQAIQQISQTFYYRVLRPWLHPDFLFKLSPTGRTFYKNLQTIQDFNWMVIKKKKEELLLKAPQADNAKDHSEGYCYKKKRTAFLELLLEYHLTDPSLTEEDIAHEVHTFMFEGHDTTAMAISWTIYFLGLDQTVQEKVFEELDDIFGDDVDRDVTKVDLSRMKYLECVIKETLRLHPSVPLFARQTQESFKIDDFTIEKGSTCLVYVWDLHRQKDYFENPEKFIPERFSLENSIGKHPYAYIPFSAGPRNCIGQKFAYMEEKTILSHIFRRFRVHSLDPRDKVVVETALITKNVDPLRVKFTLRSEDTQS